MKHVIFLLVVLLYSFPVYAQNFDGYEESEVTAPSDLPDLDSSRANILDKLKQYVATGEKLADQFENLLTDYKRSADRVMAMQAGCLNVEVFHNSDDDNIWKEANRHSICNERNKVELENRLRYLAVELDESEAELRIIQRKLNTASQEIINISKHREAIEIVNRIEDTANDVKNIQGELRELEER